LIKLQSASQLKRFIDQSDLDMTVMRLLLFSGLAGFLAAMAVSIISNSTLFLVFAGLISAALPFVHVWWKRRRRLDRFLELLPDALDLMSRALLAGHAFAGPAHAFKGNVRADCFRIRAGV